VDILVIVLVNSKTKAPKGPFFTPRIISTAAEEKIH
jgi:hypothetical protein